MSDEDRGEDGADGDFREHLFERPSHKDERADDSRSASEAGNAADALFDAALAHGADADALFSGRGVLLPAPASARSFVAVSQPLASPASSSALAAGCAAPSHAVEKPAAIQSIAQPHTARREDGGGT